MLAAIARGARSTRVGLTARIGHVEMFVARTARDDTTAAD